MLSSLVKEHNSKQSKLKEVNEQYRKEALGAIETATNLSTDNVSESVNEVFATQRKLEKEVKGLQTNTAHFARQTHQWLDMIHGFNGSLKEVGDFQNWAKTVEWDMRNIASALDYVQRSEAKEQGFPSAEASEEFPAAASAEPST
mmetsp:Transcript_30390/g.47607  ORF Transcript_30390/g.47607 Transcript_30390/m.47607 type:complete len:145 (-) Transcript_30390:84-518(-)|eukprot:CAMPEP_0184297376 /NCGR_PEP_ID=MMETSP1049-20130417/8300_1 /TAXON_ID=77928 /ORGANISM="Proteomonas sulcata, Strain CCMP704" /LENGTH=144 /DNA_ID=CAMNT_0026607083 /DNA_START=35 /DNA_END=469 /DNA_ORIENTATION=+